MSSPKLMTLSLVCSTLECTGDGNCSIVVEEYKGRKNVLLRMPQRVMVSPKWRPSSFPAEIKDQVEVIKRTKSTFEVEGYFQERRESELVTNGITLLMVGDGVQ